MCQRNFVDDLFDHDKVILGSGSLAHIFRPQLISQVIHFFVEHFLTGHRFFINLLHGIGGLNFQRKLFGIQVVSQAKTSRVFIFKIFQPFRIASNRIHRLCCTLPDVRFFRFTQM